MCKFSKKRNDHKYEKGKNGKSQKNPKSTNPDDDVHTVQVTPNIRLYEQTTDGTDHRPIVLIFGWLRGKERHLRKYTDIYLNQGCDVIQIQVGVKEILIPNAARRLVRKVRSLCEENDRRSQPIFVHTFSSGVYLYGQFLLIETNTTDTDIQTDSCEDNGVQNRICGQIYDSPTDMYGFPLGLAEVATNNIFFKRFIKGSAELYLRIATRSAEAFERSTEAVKANANGAPVKAIYSLEDKMCRPAMLEEARDRLIEQDIVILTMAEGSKKDENGDKVTRIRKPMNFNPCSTTELEKAAESFCVQCKEYFCDECSVLHKKFKISKSHKIIAIAEMEELSTEENEQDHIETRKQTWKDCVTHPGHSVEQFCKAHVTLCCSLCVKGDHSTCSLEGIETAAKGFVGSEEYSGLVKRLADVKIKISNLMNEKFHKAEASLKTYSDQSKAQLHKVASSILKDFIETHGDKLLTELLNDIIRSKSQLRNMAGEIQRFQVTMDSKVYFEEELFVHANRQKSKLAEICNFIDACTAKLPNPWITFINPENDALLSKFIGLKRTTRKYVVVKRRDEADCKISDIECLSDGRYILADASNNNLKLFLRNDKLTFVENIGGKPHTVVEIESGKVAVLLPEEKVIQFYQITEHFEGLNKVELQDTPTGMAVIDKTLFVSFSTYICVMENYTQLQDKISKNENGENIRRIFINKKNRQIYVIDSYHLCMFPVTAIRKPPKRSYDNYSYNYSTKISMAFADDDSILCCCTEYIEHLTPDLKLIQQYSYDDFVGPVYTRGKSGAIFRSKDIFSIGYNINLGRLYVGGDSNSLSIIQIG